MWRHFNPDDIFNAMHAAVVGAVFSGNDWTPETWALFSGIVDALCSSREWTDVRAGGVDLSDDEYELSHPDEFGAPF